MIDGKIYTYKDIEAARAFIWKDCIFFNELREFEGGKAVHSRLDLIEDSNFPFADISGDYWQFMLPIPKLEYEYVPF
jgi:hypothetical protein